MVRILTDRQIDCLRANGGRNDIHLLPIQARFMRKYSPFAPHDSLPRDLCHQYGAFGLYCECVPGHIGPHAVRGNAGFTDICGPHAVRGNAGFTDIW